MKRQKLEPCLINSRDAMEAVAASIIKLKLERVEATAVMEQEIADVQKRHQARLLDLSQRIEERETGVFNYCTKNRADLFRDKKSLETPLAVLGFEITPPRVEKIKRKEKWSTIALRVAGFVWGSHYVRHPDPELDKDAILADRATLTAEQLKSAGLEIKQDENFFIRPKSDVAEQSVRAAA